MTDRAPPTSQPDRSGAEQPAGDRSFGFQEYSALREELVHHVSVNETIEREALIASVAVYVWVLTQAATPWEFRIFVLFLPLILNYVGWKRARAHGYRIQELGLYIQALEARFGTETTVELPPVEKVTAAARVSVKGWEHYLAAMPEARRGKLARNYDLRWKLYCAATLLLPVAIAIWVLK